MAKPLDPTPSLVHRFDVQRRSHGDPFANVKRKLREDGVISDEPPARAYSTPVFEKHDAQKNGSADPFEDVKAQLRKDGLYT